MRCRRCEAPCKDVLCDKCFETAASNVLILCICLAGGLLLFLIQAFTS